MYNSDPFFETPDDSVIVWRYMDFEKFVDLLLSSTLYFCRSDNFQDPFEGVLYSKELLTNIHFSRNQKLSRKYMFVNCWHENDYESDAMWKIFLKSNNGIAIKSSIGQIKKSLEKCDKKISIGSVQYTNNSEKTLGEILDESETKRVHPIVHKRISFMHEREVRLIHLDLPIPNDIKDQENKKPQDCIRANVDLVHLIIEVHIAPFADKSFYSLVKSLITNLGYNFTVKESGLYDQSILNLLDPNNP